MSLHRAGMSIFPDAFSAPKDCGKPVARFKLVTLHINLVRYGVLLTSIATGEKMATQENYKVCLMSLCEKRVDAEFETKQSDYRIKSLGYQTMGFKIHHGCKLFLPLILCFSTVQIHLPVKEGHRL